MGGGATVLMLMGGEHGTTPRFSSRCLRPWAGHACFNVFRSPLLPTPPLHMDDRPTLINTFIHSLCPTHALLYYLNHCPFLHSLSFGSRRTNERTKSWTNAVRLGAHCGLPGLFTHSGGENRAGMAAAAFHAVVVVGLWPWIWGFRWARASWLCFPSRHF